MNINTVVNVVLIAAAVVWILWKQIQPAPVKTRLLVLAPLVMGYFGIRNTPGSTWSSAADVTLILVGAVFAIALGLARGATIRVWRERDGRVWRQGSRTTLLLWGVLLLVRVIMAGVAVGTHHKAADGLGPILLSLAVSFAAQNAVTGLRMSALADAAPEPTAAWAEDQGSASVAQAARVGQAPQMRSAAPAAFASSLYDRREQRRADRHARRSARRQARYDRYQ